MGVAEVRVQKPVLNKWFVTSCQIIGMGELGAALNLQALPAVQ